MNFYKKEDYTKLNPEDEAEYRRLREIEIGL